VAEGVVDDISHEGLRILLRAEDVTFQRLKTWKASKDPRYAAKKARIEQLYAIADREVTPADDDPEIVFCVDELRHSGASPMLAQGTPLHVVSEVLGHASIAITKDVYGHLLEGDKRAAAQSMSRALFGG